MAHGSGDAGTKHDQPSDQQGKGTPAKEELQTQEAAQDVGQQQGGTTPSADPGRSGAAAEDAPEVEPAERGTPQADGTAAAETGIEKAAADAGATGAQAPAKPRRARRRPKPAAEEAPAAAPRPQRRRTNDPTGRVTVRAKARFVRSSARKARLVADHVRGKDVDEARAILAFSPRSVAEDWRKLLESAIANAENNHDLVGDDLRVLNATADEGPTLKRYRPRAMGRATRIRKRTSHLTITLTPKD